eukprot:scaffold54868_cov61-Phaeocystis_antarctica.AAC.2
MRQPPEAEPAPRRGPRLSAQIFDRVRQTLEADPALRRVQLCIRLRLSAQVLDRVRQPPEAEPAPRRGPRLSAQIFDRVRQTPEADPALRRVQLCISFVRGRRRRTQRSPLLFGRLTVAGFAKSDAHAARCRRSGRHRCSGACPRVMKSSPHLCFQLISRELTIAVRVSAEDQQVQVVAPIEEALPPDVRA